MKTEDHIEKRINEFIEREKSTEHNPFLAARIMVLISEKPEQSGWLNRKVQVAVIAAGILLAIFTGIREGEIGQPSREKQSYAVMNDQQMEDFELLNQIINE